MDAAAAQSEQSACTWCSTSLTSAQVWRTEFTASQRNVLLRPPMAALPPYFRSASAYHIGECLLNAPSPFAAVCVHCALRSLISWPSYARTGVHPVAAPLDLLQDLRATVDKHEGGEDAISLVPCLSGC